MTDLMRSLYEFTSRRRMGRMWDDPEYQDYSCYALHQEETLRNLLDQEGIQVLNDMLSELTSQHAVELEVMFQATLSLCGELNGLL